MTNLSFNDKPKPLSLFIKESTLATPRDKVIGDCFSFLYEGISKYIDDNNASGSETKLLGFRDALIHINIVKIVSSSSEDSYTIFEILNARGQELEDHELQKNYIMRYIVPESNRDDAKIFGRR